MTLLDIAFALDQLRGAVGCGGPPTVAPSRVAERVREPAPKRASEDRETRDSKRGCVAD